MSEQRSIELEPDEPPKSGVWVDTDDVIEHPTEEELEAGREEGTTVNTGDDDE